MSFTCNLRPLRVGSVTLAAALAIAGGALTAQDTDSDCAQFEGAQEIACLREALARTQQALVEAEKALEASEVALGAEQAARRAGLPAPKEDQRFTSVIVASERAHPNRLLVRLENGQVWRQIQGDTQIVLLPSNGRVNAEFSRSGFGGYRMRLPDMGRVVKVERLQ